jgi:hypothetical protein
MRELEITPDPADPAVAAAIAIALAAAERELGLTAGAPHERSEWAAAARSELADDGLG